MLCPQFYDVLWLTTNLVQRALRDYLHMKFHGHYKKLQTKSALHHICLNNLCYDVWLYDNKKMVLDGYSSDEDWEKFKWQKRNDSIDHEKTSYVRSVGCYDVVWDDYDVDNHCDIVKALLS